MVINMTSYLFTKEELSFLTSLICEKGCLPEGYCSYSVSTRNEDRLDSLMKKRYLISRDPVVVDKVIAFILTRLATSDKFVKTADGKCTVCHSENMYIALTYDKHIANGVRLTPLRNENELEELLYEIGSGSEQSEEGEL